MSIIKRVTITTIICIASTVAANLILDPYRVFNLVAVKGAQWPHFSFNKIERVMSFQEKPDSWMIGSSRMGLYSTSYLNQVSGHQYYNLSLLGGQYRDILKHLVYLKSNGVEFKRVLFGIDIYTFTTPNEINETVLHPDLSKDHISFWTSHLFKPALKRYLEVLVNNVNGESPIAFDWESGGYSLVAYEKEIAKDHGLYLQKFDRPLVAASGMEVIVKERLEDYIRLVKWFEKNNVDVVAFVHPINRLEKNIYSEGFLKEFQSLVIAHSPFNLVSFLDNECLSNNYTFWYEHKHYRKELSNWIIERLFSNESADSVGQC